MRLFTVGPVQLYPEVTNVKREQIPYFRTDLYGDLVKDNLLRLAALLGTLFDNNILYLTASGTAAMEATVENCLGSQDKALVINGGSFGHRFCELCAWHNISYSSIDLAWDETLTAQHLLPYENKGYTALIVNLHETSIGQLYDIKLLSDFCKHNNMYLIVDAISTFLVDDYEMDRYGIDVTIFSSQKGLCLSPGLSFVAMSKRMVEKVQKGTPKSMYFDFKPYLKDILRGQTPFTPATFIMYELQAMLDLIDKMGGKHAWQDAIADKAIYFRKKAKSLGFSVKESTPQSNMMTVLQFEDVSARDIFLKLSEKYNIFVNPCGGDLAAKLMRVSHAGNISKADIDDLLEKLILIVQEIKNDKK